MTLYDVLAINAASMRPPRRWPVPFTARSVASLGPD